jgi:pimeloyl-ACP methyl ester carboxylesterase
MALVYMRRHEKNVRTAILNGVAPISFKNPLFHAWAAQKGLDTIFEEIENDERKRAAFPGLREKFATILGRLDQKPAKVEVAHSNGKDRVEVELDREAFCEALRVMMYYMPSNRRVPAMLLRAHAGDYRPFAENALRSNRSLRNMLALGMLMSVVGTEDIPRISEEEIVRETANTFLGDSRVRQQMAVAVIWPRGDAGSHYGDPVSVDTPTLLLSGTHDPVTPPRFGAEAAKTLRNSLHLVVPGAHGVGGACIDSIIRRVFETGSVAGIDTSCTKKMRLPPLRAPKPKKQRRL